MKEDIMSEKEANVSEMLLAIYNAFTDISEGFSQRSESVNGALELFLQVIHDEDSLRSLISNKSARLNLNNHIQKLLDLNKNTDSLFLKNLQQLQEQCALLSKLIVQANKDSIRIS
jgi:hypothetical protein